MTDDRAERYAAIHQGLRSDLDHLADRVDRELGSMAQSLEKIAGNGVRRGDLEKATDAIEKTTAQMSALTTSVALVDKQTKINKEDIAIHRRGLWGLLVSLLILFLGWVGKIVIAAIP